MLEEKKSLLNKPIQKLIYTKDSSYNFGSPQTNGDPSILNLFKSTSSLARSIRNTSDTSNPLKSTASLILNQSLNFNNSLKNSLNSENQKNQEKTNILALPLPKIAEAPKETVDIKIRNIIHDYRNIDVNDYTYGILSNLKSKKRGLNLDTIDDYELWKTNYINETENNVKENISNLKDDLNNTQSELNSKFSMKDEELVELVQNDIDNISSFYHTILKDRNHNINVCNKFIMKLFNECFKKVNNRIVQLGRQLDTIGFLREEQIKDVIDDKKLFIQRFVDTKKDFYNRIINEIKDSEKEILEETNKAFLEFILRWKNIKLNHFISELKKLLQSKEFTDNSDRANIMSELKESQMNIYNKRNELLFQKLFKLQFDEITTNGIEAINKTLEDIFDEGEKLFTNHIKQLMKNSDDIEKKSLFEIENFKTQVDSISYDFTKDNHNEKKYNDFDELNSIDDLIEKEIKPLLEKNKEDRMEFIKKINSYINEYDDYTNNIIKKIISVFLNVGKAFDEHKKNLHKTEKDYLISLAKEGDHDEEICNNKEEELKKISEEMRNCINKEELDEGLNKAFKVMDELESEYRDYFKKVDDIYNSHEGILNNAYHDYEKNVLKNFGIYSPDNKYEIEKRRNKESEFLSKKKEAEEEEERKKLEEEQKEAELTGKKAPAPKKTEKKVPKKGENVENLIPPREILEFKSKLGYDYLIDFNIDELVRHFLRNVIYNRDDDIFELKPKSPEELERIQKEKEEREKEEKEMEENKGKKKVEKKEVNKENQEEEKEIDYLNEFDVYNADTNKNFESPVNSENEKLLSEENDFKEENLTKGLNDLFNMVQENILNRHNDNIEDAKNDDDEKREDQLNDLDIRLKSLAPRKGKIEVDEYDTRLAELEKHDLKLNKHKEDIIQKNEKDNEDNKKLLEDLDNKFNKLKEEYEKLSKGIEEEETSKGLDDKYKKFKTSYYDFISDLNENENLLKEFSEKNPNALMNLNKNYILSLLPISKGGTYSDREIEFTTNELNKLEDETIKPSMEERKKLNEEKLKQIKDDCDKFMKDIENKYAIANENIMAKEAIGKKFGLPRRIVNDIIIQIKIKCNLAQDGLNNLYKELVNMINSFDNIKDLDKLNEALIKNDLPLNVRKQLQKINSCVWNYGKYIEAFKQNLLDTYQLSRVIMRENVESHEIVEKEDIDLDEKLKKDELLCLGILGQILSDNNPQNQGDKKKGGNVSGNDGTFNNEIKVIDEKIRSECAKIYTGNFAKFLNPTEKIPDSLIPFLNNTKNDMELMRLKFVKDLRTFCQNLYKFSINIPESVIKFIFSHTCLMNNNEIKKITNEYIKEKKLSEKTKKELFSILGPYLANPYYLEKLNEMDNKELKRNEDFIKKLNETQFNLIVNEEEKSNAFTIRLLNNFACLLTLFDNFIFEEEFISLGDEEYFKKRQNYNDLLKLKDSIENMNNEPGDTGGKKGGNKNNYDASQFDLDSKRTFKKVYKGINFKEGKINYYSLFTDTVKDIVEDSEEKIKILEEEYKKDNWSKSMTGIKLQNNKNLFLFRNDYYKQHCDQFNENINEYINKYNKERVKDLEYHAKWNDSVKSLKSTLEQFNKDTGNIIQKEVEEEEIEKKKK